MGKTNKIIKDPEKFIGKIVLVLFAAILYFSCSRKKIDYQIGDKADFFVDSLSINIYKSYFMDTTILNKIYYKTLKYEAKNNEPPYNKLKYFVYISEMCHKNDKLYLFFDIKDNFQHLSKNLVLTNESFIKDTLGYFNYRNRDFFIDVANNHICSKTFLKKENNISNKKIEIKKIGGYKYFKNKEWVPLLNNYYTYKYFYDGKKLKYVMEDETKF